MYKVWEPGINENQVMDNELILMKIRVHKDYF